MPDDGKLTLNLTLRNRICLQLYATSWKVLSVDASRTALSKLFNTWRGVFREQVLSATLAQISRGSVSPVPSIRASVPPGAASMQLPAGPTQSLQNPVGNGNLLPLYGQPAQVPATPPAPPPAQGHRPPPMQQPVHLWGGVPYFGPGVLVTSALPPFANPPPADIASFQQMLTRPTVPSAALRPPSSQYAIPNVMSSTPQPIAPQLYHAPYSPYSFNIVSTAEAPPEGSRLTPVNPAAPAASVPLNVPSVADVGPHMLSTLSNWLSSRDAPAAGKDSAANSQASSRRVPDNFDPAYIKVENEMHYITRKL